MLPGAPFWQVSSFTLPLLENYCIEVLIWVCHNHYFANQCWHRGSNLILLNNTLNMIFFSNWKIYVLVEKPQSIICWPQARVSYQHNRCNICTNVVNLLQSAAIIYRIWFRERARCVKTVGWLVLYGSTWNMLKFWDIRFCSLNPSGEYMYQNLVKWCLLPNDPKNMLQFLCRTAHPTILYKVVQAENAWSKSWFSWSK